MKKVTEKNEQLQRVKRCMRCRENNFWSYHSYPRLGEYMTCKKTGKRIVDIDECPEGK